MKIHLTSRLVLASFLLGGSLVAETVKDREGAVRQDRARMEQQDRWIYNDFEKGFAEAKRLNKPLLVALRCVPCLACAGIDTQVLLEADALKGLLDQFVCVRVINANALDMQRFQFDYDLSFSTMFFNGDGTVYGRFGSWYHQVDAQEKSLMGFRKALEGALDLHRNYPENREALRGKQGRPFPYKTPVQMPKLSSKFSINLNWDGKVVQSCVHCHQIGDSMRESYRDRNQTLPANWIYPFPGLATIGLEMAPDAAGTVMGVSSGSAAAKAGFLPGDEVVELAGQPVVSVADMSWVLHWTPSRGALEAKVKRQGDVANLSLVLEDGWRDRTNIERRVGTWGMRAMGLGGLKLADLSDEQRKERGLGLDGMALLADHVGQYGNHAVAKRAGFLQGDVIVEADSIGRRMSESELIGYLLQRRAPGESVTFRVQRGEELLKFEFLQQ